MSHQHINLEVVFHFLKGSRMKITTSVLIFAVLLFFLSTKPYAATFYVSPLGNDSAAGSSSTPWKTLQHAANSVNAGDTVLINSGNYAGFRASTGGSAGSPITFQANAGASVVINSAGSECIKGSIIEIEGCDGWILDGLEVTGASRNAGIDIRVADHITVRNCNCHHNRKWGIFTAFADDFTAEYNECNHAFEEHGIYHSNSGDRAVIRYNTCHHNAACGIQINADPSMGGDGISSNCMVTHNILYENGAMGGAAINLASVRDSLIGDNLIFNNSAGGIAAWDDGQGVQWGSKNNRYYNNTVHMPSESRWGVNLKNGSTGSRVWNNILIHENAARGGLEIDGSSLTEFSSNHNTLTRVSVDETVLDLSGWQTTYSQDAQSFSQTAIQTFVSSGSDYHLLETAPAIDAGATLPEIPDDLDGNIRPQGAAYDMGAYEFVFAQCPDCSGDTVVLENITFASNTTCECVGDQFIIIGAGVVVEPGAMVTFKAPVVKGQDGFHTPNGATVHIRQ
jgi:Right handed beta helix region